MRFPTSPKTTKWSTRCRDGSPTCRCCPASAAGVFGGGVGHWAAGGSDFFDSADMKSQSLDGV